MLSRRSNIETEPEFHAPKIRIVPGRDLQKVMTVYQQVS
jgi:hypothetical protein